MRLVDADALVKVPNVNCVYEYDETGCAMRYKAVPLAVIEAAPTIDAVQVVHARWEEDRMDFRCSNCKTLFTEELYYINGVDGDLPKYCPECGAKMDAKEE